MRVGAGGKKGRGGASKRATSSPAKKAKAAKMRTVLASLPDIQAPVAQPVLTFVGKTGVLWREASGRQKAQFEGDRAFDQPPLAISLTTDDLAAFAAAEGANALSATHFGPADQDKASNEDAALAASFDEGSSRFSFACVSDGVSTKTFWPERASRLAALVAYKVCRRRVADPDVLSPAWIETVREELAGALRAAFLADRNALLRGPSPSGWTEAMYQRYREQDRFWYNTTLVLSLVGPTGGMALWSGDGGVLLEKRYTGKAPVRASPLETGEGVTVTNVPSLAGQIAFNAVRINLADGASGLRVLLMTDGSDRTLARVGDRWAWLDANISSSGSLLSRLTAMAADPACEKDNLSAAMVSWPPPSAPKVIAKLAPKGVPIDKSTRQALAKLDAVAERWPRAVAALLLRACKRDEVLALSTIQRMRVETGARWLGIEDELNSLANDPAALNAEIRSLRQMRDALQDL